MLNDKELDQKLDKLIIGESVEETDPLIDIAKDITALKKIKIKEDRFGELKDEFVSTASKIEESQKSQEAVQVITKPKKIYFMNLRRAAAAALVLLISSGTTAYAATGAMPDSQLYTVKRASETASIYLTPSFLKSGLEEKISKERIREIKYMLKKKNTITNEEIIKELMTDVKDYGKTISEEKNLKDQIKKLDTEFNSKFNRNSKSTEKKNNDFKLEEKIDKQNNSVGKNKNDSEGNSRKP